MEKTEDTNVELNLGDFPFVGCLFVDKEKNSHVITICSLWGANSTARTLLRSHGINMQEAEIESKISSLIDQQIKEGREVYPSLKLLDYTIVVAILV